MEEMADQVVSARAGRQWCKAMSEDLGGWEVA